MMRWMSIAIAVAMPSMLLPTAAPISAQEPSRQLVKVAGPNATACLTLLEPGDEGTGNFGGFRNTCGYTVAYTHCVENPAEGSWGSTAACRKGAKNDGLDFVGPGAVSGAHVTGGTRVHWFACAYSKKPGEGPDGIWGDVVFDGSVLRGECLVNRYVAVAPPPKPTVAAPGAAPDIDQLRARALTGDTRSQFQLGEAYRRGIGVGADMTQAMDWYRKAADAGAAYAEIAYGRLLYDAGRKAEAARYLEKTAREGNAVPQYLYAVMLWKGDGVPRDPARARALMAQAAAHGLGPAQKALVVMGEVAAATPPAVPVRGVDATVRTRSRADTSTKAGSNYPDRIWAACQGEASEFVAAYNALPPDNRSETRSLENQRTYSLDRNDWTSMPMDQLERLVSGLEYQRGENAKRHTQWPQNDRVDAASTNFFLCIDSKWLALRRAGVR